MRRWCRAWVLSALLGVSASMAFSQARPAPSAQADPVVGNWRGTLKNAQGVDSPIIITVAKRGDGYAGSTNGLNAVSEIPLRTLTVDGAKVSLEASAESRLGDVALRVSSSAPITSSAAGRSSTSAQNTRHSAPGLAREARRSRATARTS